MPITQETRLSVHRRRSLLRRVVGACSILLLGTALSSVPSNALAGLVPTPPAGTGTPVTVPAPNPLQYNAVSGAVISSQQFNSNFWKSYNDINAIASALNSCSYSTGTGVTSVTATSPINASIGSCVPGTGSTLTLSLASTGAFPSQTFVATLPTNAYQWNGSLSAAGDAIGMGSASAGIGSITCDSYRLENITTAFNLMCIDGVGDGVINGDWDVQGNSNVAGNLTSLSTMQGMSFVARPSGTSYPVPWLYSPSGPTTTAHIDIGGAGTFSVPPLSCTSSALTFHGGGFTSIPSVSFQLQYGGSSANALQANEIGAPSTTGVSYSVCNYGSAGTTTVTITYMAVGV